mmetsp:Transcript_18608/g.45736  ORF Transcript_18608/g.45736 Transcript_18608/m.45736 type:complete len:462 (-) Transcript_18608:334-1719(-)|eukprot:CAMPEP_0206247830 /NCGR_PEP_ID=MMETSP0047_2-20121206/20028_1 /ASSEMBLY_ACC=CAM_ASM_000192 /TAXON_ID=195065 /ORGANISM="Chroomonas mesostigmatica_cf, Strain CCMP1168" /LENGTH=461 /DNA_ID=CAMNT_0053673399 /DNA_START=104 /DNA_END=1489 /DNA_ORIENTATION=-
MTGSTTAFVASGAGHGLWRAAPASATHRAPARGLGAPSLRMQRAANHPHRARIGRVGEGGAASSSTQTDCNDIFGGLAAVGRSWERALGRNIAVGLVLALALGSGLLLPSDPAAAAEPAPALHARNDARKVETMPAADLAAEVFPQGAKAPEVVASSLKSSSDGSGGGAAAVGDGKGQSPSVKLAGIGSDMKRDIASGLVAGSASRAIKGVVVFPLDTVRVRLQQGKRKGEEEESPFKINLKQAYAGGIPALLCAGPTAAVFFSVNGALKQLLPMYGISDMHIATLVAAALASCLAWSVRTPFEVIKTSIQGGKHPDTLKALKGIVWDEGLVALWRPLPRYLAQYLPGDPIKMATYQYSTMAWTVANGGMLHAWQQSACGSLAYCVVTVLSNPVSVANTRMILEPNRDANLLGCIARISKEEGPHVLLAGLSPRLGKAIVSGALTFGLFEVARAVINNAMA